MLSAQNIPWTQEGEMINSLWIQFFNWALKGGVLMRDGGICDSLLSVGKETIQGQPYFVLKPEYWAKSWTRHLTNLCDTFGK